MKLPFRSGAGFIGNRTLKAGHKLIVVSSTNLRKIVTLIDTSKNDIINKRKEKGRWIKIN